MLRKAPSPRILLEDHKSLPDNDFVNKLTRTEIQSFLQEETFFRGAGDEAIRELSAIALQKIVPQGRVLFSMGQSCEALNFVVEGCGLLVKVSPEGRQHILHRAVVGDMVGCVPFFDRGDYPASFIAETECTVLCFPREELLRQLEKDSGLAFGVIGGLVNRLRMMASVVEHLSFDDAQHRLWNYLLEESESVNEQEFPRILDPLPTREHIASAVGTVREVISRRLSHLVKSGNIKIEGRRVTLLKPLE